MTAVAGLGLSVYNALRARSRDRVHLSAFARWVKGTPREPDASGDGTNWLVIEIVNASTFPVMLRQGGFESHGGKPMDEAYSTHGRFPFTLEARSSANLKWQLAWMPQDYVQAIETFYAITATGETVRVKKKQWQQIKPQLADAVPS